MNQYELTLVLPGKSKAKEKTATEKIEKLVKTFEGKIEKSETWGEIELAYRIKKEKSGYFLHFNLNLNPKFTKTLNEKLRVDGEFIRYLLIRKD